MITQDSPKLTPLKKNNEDDEEGQRKYNSTD